MVKTSSGMFFSSVLILAFGFGTLARANNSFCDSWTDADFAEDANQSNEFLNFITAPDRLEPDLVYNDRSSDKPKVDQHFKFDAPENVRCKKLAVQGDKISVKDAAAKYAEALAKFRGCTPKELKQLVEHQRKQFSEKLKGPSSPLVGEKLYQAAPEKVHRLNWTAEYFAKTDGKVFAFVSDSSVADENFGTALFKLKTRDGKTVIKRVPITSVAHSEFCAGIPAMERRLNALYEQEQNRLLAKQSDDGTAECLAWFSSSKEFNGKPAGTGLMSYLKIEPLSASSFHFDPAYTQAIESEIPGTTLKKLTLQPYQSQDRISIVRDADGKLVTAELFTPGVRKSRFGDEQFFNKIIDFDYSSGRCQPKTIEYSETAGKFKISNDACRQLERGDTPQSWTKIETEMKTFIKVNNLERRKVASIQAKQSVKPAPKAPYDSRGTFKSFCQNFEYYLE